MKYRYLSSASVLYTATTVFFVGAKEDTSFPNLLWTEAGANTCPANYAPIKAANMCSSASKVLGVKYDRRKNGGEAVEGKIAYCFVSNVDVNGKLSESRSVSRINNDYGQQDSLLCRKARFIMQPDCSCPDDYVPITDTLKYAIASKALNIRHDPSKNGNDESFNDAACFVSFFNGEEEVNVKRPSTQVNSNHTSHVSWICERRRATTRPTGATPIPTSNPTAGATTSPTRYLTTDPTDGPTMDPTTTNPTGYPTYYTTEVADPTPDLTTDLTAGPTGDLTTDLTYWPTKEPTTIYPTKYPTYDRIEVTDAIPRPTAGATPGPTGYQTADPTNGLTKELTTIIFPDRQGRPISWEEATDQFLDLPPPSYIRQKRGVKVCPNQYAPITDKVTCATASAQLNIENVPHFDRDWSPGDPVVCFVTHVDWEENLNNPPWPSTSRVSSNHGMDDAWICQLDNREDGAAPVSVRDTAVQIGPTPMYIFDYIPVLYFLFGLLLFVLMAKICLQNKTS